MALPKARLVGPLSGDRYLDTYEVLPGGGVLNMAYHWSQASMDFEVISRVAAGDRLMFENFGRRHSIEFTPDLVAAGDPCTIDVRFGPDRQPVMDNFVAGVLDDFTLTPAEIERVTDGTPTHLVLVDVVDHEIRRLTDQHRLDGVVLTADFLSFRHFTTQRFEATFALLQVGFIGWPGAPSDPILSVLSDIAANLGGVLVVTFGASGVTVVDGRSAKRRDTWFGVDAREVTGTTIGCGDAFIAAFLAEWIRHDDIDAAVRAGCDLGAAATEWRRPLPDAAYGP